MKFLKKMFGIKDPPSLMEQTLDQARAKLAAQDLFRQNWIDNNQWYNDWRSYAADAMGTFGSFGNQYEQAKAINDLYQADTDALYGQNMGSLLDSGVGSYESDQMGLFNQRTDARNKQGRTLQESNKQNFSNALAQLGKSFGVSQGGYGSGFASALGDAFQQHSQKSAEMLGDAAQSTASDRTNVYDKVRSAKMSAPQQIDAFRKTALDSMLAPAETALSAFDSISSRERQNAPQFA